METKEEPWIRTKRFTSDMGDMVYVVQGYYDEETGGTMIQMDFIPAIERPKVRNDHTDNDRA